MRIITPIAFVIDPNPQTLASKTELLHHMGYIPKPVQTVEDAVRAYGELEKRNIAPAVILGTFIPPTRPLPHLYENNDEAMAAIAAMQAGGAWPSTLTETEHAPPEPKAINILDWFAGLRNTDTALVLQADTQALSEDALKQKAGKSARLLNKTAPDEHITKAIKEAIGAKRQHRKKTIFIIGEEGEFHATEEAIRKLDYNYRHFDSLAAFDRANALGHVPEPDAIIALWDQGKGVEIPHRFAGQGIGILFMNTGYYTGKWGERPADVEEILRNDHGKCLAHPLSPETGSKPNPLKLSIEKAITEARTTARKMEAEQRLPLILLPVGESKGEIFLVHDEPQSPSCIALAHKLVQAGYSIRHFAYDADALRYIGLGKKEATGDRRRFPVTWLTRANSQALSSLVDRLSETPIPILRVTTEGQLLTLAESQGMRDVDSLYLERSAQAFATLGQHPAAPALSSFRSRLSEATAHPSAGRGV